MEYENTTFKLIIVYILLLLIVFWNYTKLMRILILQYTNYKIVIEQH